MSLKFCPRCNTLLKIKEKKGVCDCGYETDFELSHTDIKKQKPEKGKGVALNEQAEGFPHKCKKCGYHEAEVADLGIKISDEAGIYLFKCLKCGFVEKQADGSCNC